MQFAIAEKSDEFISPAVLDFDADGIDFHPETLINIINDTLKSVIK